LPPNRFNIKKRFLEITRGGAGNGTHVSALSPPIPLPRRPPPMARRCRAPWPLLQRFCLRNSVAPSVHPRARLPFSATSAPGASPPPNRPAEGSRRAAAAGGGQRDRGEPRRQAPVVGSRRAARAVWTSYLSSSFFLFVFFFRSVSAGDVHGWIRSLERSSLVMAGFVEYSFTRIYSSVVESISIRMQI
jgi:hypothetical protein